MKQPKQVGKMPEIRKNLNVKAMTTSFWKTSAIPTNFEVSSLGLEFQVSTVSLTILMKSRSRSFNSVLVSKVTVSIASLTCVA